MSTKLETNDTDYVSRPTYLALPVFEDENWQWMSAGQCGRYPDLDFFNVASTTNVMKCRVVCDTCVVKNQCLDFAQRNDEVHGIWGSMTPKERKAL
jgi:WhiB family redox-sensing transcriptional regulator